MTITLHSQIINKFCLIILFEKVHVPLFVDPMLVGIDKSRLKSGKYQVKLSSFLEVFTDGTFDYMKSLL